MDFMKKHSGLCLTTAAFFIFFLFSCYKLTAAPLWYDETLEFYFSKVLTGPVENVTGLKNLYERLVYYGFQPPLYNLVMKVWLLFGEGEWWYRFSGVVFGMISAAGLFKTVQYKANTKTAAMAVVLYPFLYEIMYYFRECAEYAMLLAVLPWTVYIWFRAMEEKGSKNLVLFTVLCVISVYTQYGAAFIVAPLAVILLIEKWKKDRSRLKILLVSYAIAVIGAGVPLYWWFIRVQLHVQEDMGKKVHTTIEFLKGNVLYDFFKNLSYIFGWSLIDSFSVERFEILTACILTGMLLLALFLIICGKDRSLKWFFAANAASWLFYYTVVKLNIYAYGGFGNRYNIFFVPVWFLTLVLTAFSSVRLVKEKFGKKWMVACLLAVFTLSSLFVVAVNLRKMPHMFEKSHTREVVAEWYEREGYNTFTYVCFGENVSFQYYLTHHKDFKENYKDRVYMEFGDEITDTSEKSEEEYLEIIRENCGGELPKELYVSTGNRYAIVKALENAGYTSEIVYQTNTTLIFFVKDR